MPKRLPDEREAIEGAAAAAANAAGLLGDADLLAGAGSFGTAVALAVPSLEEAVKARALGAIAAAAAIGTRPGFSDDDLRKILYSGHRERHAAGFYQQVAAAHPGAYGRKMLGMPVSGEDAAALTELAGIFGRANGVKQAGLYTDFDPDAGSWSSPRSASETEFARIRRLAGDFVAESQRQLDEFTHRQPAGA